MREMPKELTPNPNMSMQITNIEDDLEKQDDIEELSLKVTQFE
jgi:hypothetical protein